MLPPGVMPGAPGGPPPGGMMPPPGGMMPGAPPGAIVPGAPGGAPGPVPGAVNPPGAVNGTAAPAGDASLTLYVNNLNDKIHPDTLSKNLREVFGAFGEIQDLICMKSIRR